MENSPTKQKAREAWRKYTYRNQAKFWQYYEHLLVSAKQTPTRNQPKIVRPAPALPKEKLYAPRSTKVHKPKNSKTKVLTMTFGLLILFALTFIIDPSPNQEYIDPMYNLERETLRAQKKADWLYARLSLTDRQKLNEWLATQQQFNTDAEAINNYMEYNRMIDWSQNPINLSSENEDIYALFTPKDIAVYFLIDHEGDIRRVLPYQKHYTSRDIYGQQASTPINPKNVYKASLKLKYDNTMVEVDKNGVVYFMNEGQRIDAHKSDYKYLKVVLNIAPIKHN